MTYPKAQRRLAREGLEVDAVIVGWREDSIDGSVQLRPVTRWIAPDGVERQAYNGLSVYGNDPRGRGDVMRLIVAPDGKDLATILVEPDSAAAHAQWLQETLTTKNPLKIARTLRSPAFDWGRRVEGTVTALAPQPDGRTRVRVAFDGREEVVGPAVAAPDPRRVGDVVDLGLGPDGRIVRPPTGPTGNGAELRAAMAREPSLARKVWDSPLFPF